MNGFYLQFLNENSRSNNKISKSQYLKDIEDTEINKRTVSKLEEMYDHNIPSIIQKMVSYSSSSTFFTNGTRSLSVSEILDAHTDLDIDFRKLGIIPLFDCGDNDFIVYNFKNSTWSKFNITDNSFFKKSNSLKDLL